jgi:hypothetical protein
LIVFLRRPRQSAGVGQIATRIPIRRGLRRRARRRLCRELAAAVTHQELTFDVLNGLRVPALNHWLVEGGEDMRLPGWVR